MVTRLSNRRFIPVALDFSCLAVHLVDSDRLCNPKKSSLLWEIGIESFRAILNIHIIRSRLKRLHRYSESEAAAIIIAIKVNRPSKLAWKDQSNDEIGILRWDWLKNADKFFFNAKIFNFLTLLFCQFIFVAFNFNLYVTALTSCSNINLVTIGACYNCSHQVKQHLAENKMACTNCLGHATINCRSELDFALTKVVFCYTLDLFDNVGDFEVSCRLNEGAFRDVVHLLVVENSVQNAFCFV